MNGFTGLLGPFYDGFQAQEMTLGFICYSAMTQGPQSSGETSQAGRDCQHQGRLNKSSPPHTAVADQSPLQAMQLQAGHFTTAKPFGRVRPRCSRRAAGVCVCVHPPPTSATTTTHSQPHHVVCMITCMQFVRMQLIVQCCNVCSTHTACPPPPPIAAIPTAAMPAAFHHLILQCLCVQRQATAAVRHTTMT